MGKQVVSKTPSDTGVGQVLTYDDGTTSYDPYMSYSASQPSPDPAAAVTAPPAASLDSTNTVDPMTGAPVPDVTAPQGVGSLGRGIGNALEIPPLQGNSPQLADVSRHFAPPAAPAAPPVGGAAPPVGGAGLVPNDQSPMVVNVPGTPGHMQLASTTTSGIAPKAAAGINSTLGEMQTQSAAAAQQQDEASNKLADLYSNHALNVYMRAQSEDLAQQALVKKNTLDQERVKAKIDDAMSFKPDRHQLFEGTGGGIAAIGAAIAMIAGGALSGLKGGPNQGADLVMHMVDENVKQQVAQNTMYYQELRSRLGDDQAAAGVLRAQHLQNVVDMSKALDMNTKSQEIRAASAGLRERAALEMNVTKLKVQQAIAPQVSSHSAFVAPTPAQQLVLGRSEMALRAMGVSPEQYQKFTEAKVDKSDVNSSIQEIKEIDQNRYFLAAAKAANGGKLPGFDEQFDWTRLGLPRAAASRLGLEKAKTAGEVYRRIAMIQFNMAKQAGRVTENELEFSKKITGQNGDELDSFLANERDGLNNKVKGVAEGMFPGKGQGVVHTFLQAVGGVPGVESGSGRPR